MSRPTPPIRALVLLTLLMGNGCLPSAGAGTATPGTGGGDAPERSDTHGEHELEDRTTLSARLERLKAKRTQVVAPAMSDAAVCEDLCSLSSSICEVKEKLCSLADRHPADESYQALCREARLECREAQDSCIRCVQGHEPEPPVSTEPK